MEYKVKFFRDLGFEAKWSRNRAGAPIIVVKTASINHRTGEPIWAYVDADMWKRAQAVGFKQAFEEHTALIGFFSIAA